jgi:hypothetical protein
MPDIHVQQTLTKAKSDFENAYIEILEPVITRLQAVLTRLADEDGVIPLQSLETAENEFSGEILDLFVNRETGEPYRNEIEPDSPYTRILNKHILSAMVGAVKGHRDFIRKRTNERLFRHLQRVDTLARVYNPYKPSAEFTPFWQWQDKRGFVLSDRIWETALNTRNKLNEYLEINIRDGRSALAMSKELEQFLKPDRANLRTNKPYGVNASFDAMRLARTEIAIAHSEVTELAASRNPFVNGMEWALSPSHPKRDVCDRLATIGMGNQRLKEPYPIDNYPKVVLSSHPQCLCVNYPTVYKGNDYRDVKSRLEQSLNENRAPPYVLPIDIRGFLIGAMGTEITMQLVEVLNEQ